MPKYRAYRFVNERVVYQSEFEAANDDVAKAFLEQGNDLTWEPADNSDSDCDVTDETLALDREVADNTDYKYITVIDEMSLPSERPYGSASREFVKKVAAFQVFGDDPACTAEMRELVAEARKLIGGKDA